MGALSNAVRNPVSADEEGHEDGPPPPKGLARFNTTFFADHKDLAEVGPPEKQLSIGQRLGRSFSNLVSSQQKNAASPSHEDEIVVQTCDDQLQVGVPDKRLKPH